MKLPILFVECKGYAQDCDDIKLKLFDFLYQFSHVGLTFAICIKCLRKKCDNDYYDNIYF